MVWIVGMGDNDQQPRRRGATSRTGDDDNGQCVYIHVLMFSASITND